MPRLDAPVVSGSSLLDKTGKQIKVGPIGTNNPNYDPRIAAAAMGYNLPYLTGNPQNGIFNPTPVSTGDPVGALNAIPKALTSHKNAADIGALAAAVAGAASAVGKGASKGIKSKTPNQFAAALRLAEKRMGAFDATPYDLAAGNAHKQASLQEQRAQAAGKRAEADDAVLYGHLKNYMQKIAHNQNVKNTNIVNRTKAGFASSQAANDKQFDTLNQQAANALASRGITAAQSGAAQAQEFQDAQMRADKGNSVGNMETVKHGANSVLRQAIADAGITGTGKIADQKATVNDTLASIASALSNQLATINESKASAANNYNSALRNAAMTIMQNRATANSPAAQADTLLKQAEAANAFANAQKTKYGLTHPTTTSSSSLGEYRKGLGDLDTSATGLPPSHEGTLKSLYQQILTGSGDFSGTDLASAVTSPQSMGSIDTIIKNEIKSRAGQGYTAADEQALLSALYAFLGK